MSKLQYVGDATGCGSGIYPPNVFMSVPCTNTCCYTTQNEPFRPHQKTRTPYDELVDSFVESNLKALEKTSIKFPKNNPEKKPILTPLELDEKVKVQVEKKQVKKNKDPVCIGPSKLPEIVKSNSKNSANASSWATKYLQINGQTEQKDININLKPKKPIVQAETTTSLSEIKMTKENLQKNINKTNTIDLFAPIRPKIKFIIPKLNQPKKDSSDVLDEMKPKHISNTTVLPKTVKKIPENTVTRGKLNKEQNKNQPLSKDNLNKAPTEKKKITECTKLLKNKYCNENIHTDIIKSKGILESTIQKINNKTISKDTKNTIAVKNKTKDKQPKSKSIIEYKKKQSPIRDLCKVKSKHALKSLQNEEKIKNNKEQGKNRVEKILQDGMVKKEKNKTKNISPVRDEYHSTNRKVSICKNNVCLINTKDSVFKKMSETFTEDEDNIFDLRQKLNKKEIIRKLEKLKNTQKVYEEYLRKNNLDNRNNKSKTNKIAPVPTLQTKIKPKEPRVKEIKLIINIIHEHQSPIKKQPTEITEKPPIKTAINDDLDFLDDFNVDEVVNCLNECEVKPNTIKYNANANIKECVTDINDNIEEKLELLFNGSLISEKIEQKTICDEQSAIQKELTIEKKEFDFKNVSEEVSSEDTLRYLNINTEFELKEDNYAAEAKCIKNSISDVSILLEEENEKVITPCFGINEISDLVNNSFLEAKDNGDNENHVINETEQNKEKEILTDTKTSVEKIISSKDNKTDTCEISTILPDAENVCEIVNKSTKKEKNIANINTDKPAWKNLDNPKVAIDGTDKISTENKTDESMGHHHIEIKEEFTDDVEVLKLKDNNKTLKRKINLEQAVNDVEKCNNTLSNKEKVLGQKLQYKMSLFFEKKFTIHSIIHRGKFSTIFNCTDPDGVHHAAKVSKHFRHRDVKEQENMIKGFQKDIPKENLNCVYLVNGFGLERNWVLLMEFYPLNLQQFVLEKKKSIHINNLQNLARQLIGAVITLRNCRIVHSDIKPKHIVVNETGTQLKLCGFDAAYYIAPAEVLPNIGSINYRAPEVIIGYSASFSIDVWSTAVVLYEMATGYQLFPGYYNNDILFKQMSTLGNIPVEMLMQAKPSHTIQHFNGKVFMRKVGFMGEKTVLIHNFTASARLSSTINKAYYKDWGHSALKAQRDKERLKICSLLRLLKQMLVIQPERRLAIEFVYASPFIHETF